MRLQLFSWRWWVLLLGSLAILAGAIGTFVGGEKPWLIVLIIGLILVVAGNPIWSGLRAPKRQ